MLTSSVTDTSAPAVAPTAAGTMTSAHTERAPRPKGWLPYLRILAVMAALAAVPNLGLPNRQVHLAVVALIWTMAAYGLFIPYAFAGQMTVAIVTAWGVGAFSTGIAITYWNWSFLPSLALATVAGFVAGGLMAMPILRTKGHYFVILTFVIAEAVTTAANNWHVTVGESGGGVTIPKSAELLGFSFASRLSMFYLCLAAVTVMALATLAIRESHLGRLFVSIRENEELARSLGVPTTALKILALAIGGLFAGAAGTFYAYYLSHISINDFGVSQAITLILILVIGGRHSILGPLAGAAITYYLPELIHLEPNRVLIAYGLALAVVVIVLPDGVLGGLSAGWRRVAAAKSKQGGSAPVSTVEAS